MRIKRHLCSRDGVTFATSALSLQLAVLEGQRDVSAAHCYIFSLAQQVCEKFGTNLSAAASGEQPLTIVFAMGVLVPALVATVD